VISHSKEALVFCPYCRSRGNDDTKVEEWFNRSVETGLATRWRRCSVCYAMFRAVYNWKTHKFEEAGHWKPKA